MDSISFSDKKLIRRSTMPPPAVATLMLKDYLLDDMSSCSSNGFRSIPRKQCCNNVKFILEFDLKNPNGKKPKPSILQRASAAVINAVKIFPRKRSILPRSLSRKLSNRSFWKKDISFIKSFKCLNDNSLSVTQPSSAGAGTISSAGAAEMSGAVMGNVRKGKSLSDSSSSVFTLDNLLSSSSNSESSCENDAVFNESSPEKPVRKIADDSSKEEWVNILEEKEQSSPVSVLDFPFDNQDDVSWPFRRNVSIHEGLKQNLPEKFKIFKSLSKLEPVDLSKRFATIELDEVSTQSDNNNNKIVEGCDEVEKAIQVEDMLELVKEACPYLSQLEYKIDGLLVDFFNERIINNVGDFSKMFDRDEAIKEAENWINGQQEELFLGWEMEKNRKVYIKYIENGGKFDEEREEIANEIEEEIFSCLLDELLVD
ncbi:uncharacterized protein LOC124942364 [Impatiens glandulifera]|uniref:uncharacterized protein LOC124942364 n=1 Tax=Impatiens glandulifera TaxID=253017 RepID=UPI001FB10DC5|nr:uncharacterized protein LOC124942364 [Impatiens glandulifera]